MCVCVCVQSNNTVDVAVDIFSTVTLKTLDTAILQDFISKAKFCHWFSHSLR
jgi:hypothetical protein